MSSGNGEDNGKQRKYRSVLYICHHVNKHTGNVTEYFRDNSEMFFSFSFAPTFQERSCVLERYEQGEKKDQREFFLYTGKNAVLRHVSNYLYFVYIALFLLPRETTVITFHATFCVGNWLLRFMRGHRVVFWIYDYFPSRAGLYRIYNALVDYYNRNLPEVLYLGPTLHDRYIKEGSISPASHREMVIYGTKMLKGTGKPISGLLGFVGQLKAYQGLEVIFEVLQRRPDFRFEIMGDGEERDRYETVAEQMGVADRVRFLGYVAEQDVSEICGRWVVGLAPYEPHPENCTMFAHPGKVRFYLQYGVPVVMTKVTHFWQELVSIGAGVAVDYDCGSLERGIELVIKDRESYREGVMAHNMSHEYQPYYDRSFSFLRQAA